MLTKHFDIVFILALLINDVAEFILYSSRNDSLFNSSLSPAPNHRWVSTVAPFPPFLDALQNCLLSEFLYCSILLNNTVFDLLSKIGSYAKNIQKLSFIYSSYGIFQCISLLKPINRQLTKVPYLQIFGFVRCVVFLINTGQTIKQTNEAQKSHFEIINAHC